MNRVLDLLAKHVLDRLCIQMGEFRDQLMVQVDTSRELGIWEGVFPTARGRRR
jgi:hypothetical protein